MVILTTIHKQILLAKLLHEYETAPDFGDQHISDYKSPQLQWITRVHAMVKRFDSFKGLEFDQVSNSMHNMHGWSAGVRKIFMEVSKVIEELKLDLELEGEDEVGKVYESNKTFDFFTDLKTLLESAVSEIFIVDPYFNGKAFKNLLSNIKPDVKIEILSKGPLADEVLPYAEKHCEQFSSVISIRKTKKTHDRVIFIDGSYGWIIGGSLNDGGKKPSYLLPLPPALAPEKHTIYKDIWSASTVIM